VYYGTSNAAPDFYSAARKGDNLYTASVVALEAKTGKLVWHRQEVPHDLWDYDSPYEMLALDKDGKKLLVHLNKGGYVSVMDRLDGSLYNVWKLSTTANWVESINPKTGELVGRNEPEIGKDKVFCPSALGARSWNHGAYNPKTGLWYTNAMEVCNKVRPGRQDPKSLILAQPFFGVESLDFVPPPGGKASARLDARRLIILPQRWEAFSLPPVDLCSTAIRPAPSARMMRKRARSCGVSTRAPVYGPVL
jgi:alcohol dehydrogenase (cytochrome c)